MREPAVVSTPSVQNRSLIASGIPSSGRGSPRAMRRSDSAAISSARSGVSVMKALSDRPAAIASRCAVVSSVAENSFLRRPARASGERELGELAHSTTLGTTK